MASVAAATTLDNEREKRRGERAEKKKLNSAWSEKVVKKEEREKRKDKKGRKKRWLKTQISSVAVGSNDMNEPSLKRSRTDDAGSGGGDGKDEDWADLAREERMAKKVRRGQVSQDMFDEEFCS